MRLEAASCWQLAISEFNLQHRFHSDCPPGYRGSDKTISSNYHRLSFRETMATWEKSIKFNQHRPFVIPSEPKATGEKIN
jgi:hypothetical protein